MQGLILALLVLLTARMAEAYQASSWRGSVVQVAGSLRARSFPRRRQQLNRGLAATTTGSSESAQKQEQQHDAQALVREASSTTTGSSEFESIREIEIVSSLDGVQVRIGELWHESDTTVLICFRSFG